MAKPPPMRWFRLYSSVLHDPKVQYLSPLAFKVWINLLCIANEHEPRGELPSVRDIGFQLRLHGNSLNKCLSRLVDAGLIDVAGDRMTIHGWKERQFDSDNVTLRTRKHRSPERSLGSNGNVPSTVSEAEADQEAEADHDGSSRLSNDPLSAITNGLVRPGNAERMSNYETSQEGRVSGVVETFRAIDTVSDQELARRKADPTWGVPSKRGRP